MIRATLLALSLALPATAIRADTVTVPTDRTVADAMNALERAVTDAGAIIVARVDHSANAATVDQMLPPAQLMIFGNPALGTQAMLDDPRAGLVLPMKMLVYEVDGQTQITYEEPETLFEGLEIAPDAEYVRQMTDALANLAAAAAG